MKLKQLINGGALAATVLTLGSAQAEQNPYNGIVFCKATISPASGNISEDVSITLPFTSNADGDYTLWNLGAVPAGGVADSWHSEGGPGKFVAHNNGRVGAYVYLTSASANCGEYSFWNGDVAELKDFWNEHYDFSTALNIYPTPSIRRWRSGENCYCLAFTRDVEAKLPTWHMLNMVNDCCSNINEQGWFRGDDWDGQLNYIGAYMGHLDAGEYMPFDVKFWAPQMPEGGEPNKVRFTFMVEAAPFPLWEHDSEVL